MRQDQDVRDPHVRLGVLLVFMRILAGHRGHSRVTWHGAGFTYELTVTRNAGDPDDVAIDADPGPRDRVPIIERVAEALRSQP